MKIPYIDLSVQKEEFETTISPLLATVFSKGVYVGGQEVETFEASFASYCGTNYAVALNSGTDALILALKALGIGYGDEVITVSNSFISTANAIEWIGAKIVFVDINDDLLIDASLLEKAITSKTKAIIPVHLMGAVCNMETINQIAQRYSLHVIEDAAQSVGSLYRGKKTGSLGTVGCFSLHPLKNLGGIGDGGVVTTNDPNIADKIKMLRNNGLKDRDHLECVGIVSRLDAINAVVLQDRLKRLDVLIAQRREKAKLYVSLLGGIDEVETIKVHTDIVHSFHIFVIKAKKRDALKAYLEEKGIETKIHYPILIHCQKPYRERNCILPNSEKLVRQILTLPLANVDKEDIQLVCNTIKDFYSKDAR